LSKPITERRQLQVASMDRPRTERSQQINREEVRGDETVVEVDMEGEGEMNDRRARDTERQQLQVASIDHPRTERSPQIAGNGGVHQDRRLEERIQHIPFRGLGAEDTTTGVVDLDGPLNARSVDVASRRPRQEDNSARSGGARSQQGGETNAGRNWGMNHARRGTEPSQNGARIRQGEEETIC